MADTSTRTPTSARRGKRTRAALDLRGPLVVDVRPLGRRPGSMREQQLRTTATALIGSELIGVPQGAPIAVDARLEAVTEGVLVTGTVVATLQGECARCLDPIDDELRTDLVELFAYPDSITDETSDADEVHRIDNDHLDLEPVVHDAVVLALPWTPLCRPDCAGLCPTCGERLDALPDGHSHDLIDPRWAALAQHAANTEDPKE